jgi:hypothetical protein
LKINKITIVLIKKRKTMKRKHLLFTLLLALVVPLAALAQVERTVTVYNGKDTECHVPLYGNVTRMDDLSISQFIMDKSVLQAAGLAGKEITKMTLHLANSVPASYEWTTKRRTVVMLAEVDASELSNDNFIPTSDMTNSTVVFADCLDARGETMEISFGTPFTYSGEKNLLVQFREEYMYYFNYHPFASYRLPMYYGVYKTGASHWKQLRASNNYSTVSSLNCHFVPKTTFTYLTEANWANTKAPKNARITASDYSTGNNNSISYYIRMDWDAADNYTGNYQVLCVPRGTTPLDWSTAATTSETFYSFGGLQKNTAYDLYVRAKSGLFFTSNAATASASTPFYPANLDEGPLTFDFNSQTMPNGLDFVCSIPRYLSAYGRLSYCNLGTNYVGATVYNDTPPVTITLPELKFTNANNGLMLDFDLNGGGQSYYDQVTGELQVKIYDDGYDEQVLLETVPISIQSHHFTFRLPDLTTSTSHNIYKLSFIYAGGTGFNLDNIVVRKAPNIMPPYNLAASEITPTSATISWLDENTGTHSLELYYRLAGNSAWISGCPISVTGTSHTLTGLTPYSDYEVMVKTIVGSDYSNSEIYSFSTLCTPAVVPYYEPFTGLTTLPTDWRVNVPEYAEVVTEMDNDRLTMHNTVTEVTEYYYDYPFTYTHYSDFSAYIILPYFNNLGSLQLSFKAGRTQGALESLQVGVVADPKNYVSFTQIGTATLTDNANGEVYSFNLVNNAVQNGHIVIRLYNSDDVVQSIWLDDFSVQQYAAPTNLEVLTTNNSASLSWNAGAATEWEVRYKATTDSNWGSAIAVTEPTYTITGLTANTEYTAQVRAMYGDDSHSEWNDGDFGTFKTLMQEAVVMNAENASYNENFDSGNGNWLFIDGGGEVNRWRRFSYINMNYGNLGYGLRVTYSTDNSATTQWKYRTGYSYSFGNNSGFMATPATSYAVKTFTLSAGHYEFGYDYAVKGRANDDYMRVVLVPAQTVFEAGVLPAGFDYNNTPNDWFALDGGHQLVGNANNSNYYGWNAQSPITLDVYPGGTYEPGNYMIVVLWKNEGTLREDQAQNPPGAIDNVRVTWSSLVYPPEVSYEASQATDTEAPMYLYAPQSGIAPTSYEAQYEPALAHNNYVGAPIASFAATSNPVSATLTGLTPHTLYNVRIRSVYTTNGHSVYSDWGNYASMFTTKYPRPTHLVVVGQTSSWANVRWNPVEMTLPDQYINYCVQLTTDLTDWGDDDCGWSSDSWEKNLAPGTYHFRVQTAVYQEEENLYMGGSDWSDPITFTIAPWTDPVTIFPLTYGFEEPLYRFADGITLSDDFDRFGFYNYYNQQDQLPAHADGESQHLLAYRSSSNSEACLVLPPMSPSDPSADLLVSFWWYHFDSETNSNVGVTIEYSYDGTTWQSAGDKITRFADETGWVKYEQVVRTESTPTYVRLRFEGVSNSQQWWNRCYLDDLKVDAIKSEQPYISYVAPGENSVTITLYDYAFENGYPSSAFKVQYREYREPGQTEESWNTCPLFDDEEPAFEHELTVTGLQPLTLYEFRACACVSYGDIDYWSGYCEPYRQWTNCGTYTITPSYTFTEGFEDEFYLSCWEADEGWEMQHEGGYNGAYCAYISAGTYNRRLYTPAISFENCDNVIIRFWAKGQGRVEVHYGENFETTKSFSILPETNDWTMIELPLSSYMSNAPFKVVFRTLTSKEWYVDNISIIANAYAKIFDDGGRNMSFWSANHWYPSGIPTETDDVMIMGNAYTGNNYVARTIDFGVSVGKLVVYGDNKALTATTINASKENAVEIRTGSTLNVTTLNAGAANSVVVNDGGVLYAATITGTSPADNNKVVVEDGGQLKTDQEAFVTLKKKIGSYTTIEQENNVTRGGYYLISIPLNMNNFNPYSAGALTSVVENGQEVLTYDLYKFDYEQELEWRNYKDDDFLMKNGYGYLYANRDGVDLSFAGPVAANNTQMPVSTNYGQGSHYDFNGWTLVGNPMTCNAYVSGSTSDMSFFRMNPVGNGFIAATGTVAPMEGIFVYTQVAGQAVFFNRDEPTEPGSKLGINLMQGNVLVDNAIIRFGQGGTLPKFSFSNNTSKVYIPMADDDYAVVSSQPVGVLPLNFEAAKDGTYTLSFEDATEGLLYCHLIDNKTGADVDLLATPDYAFNAKADDYASRFKVVFVANDEDGSLTGSDAFAFNNNGNWIIANEGRATLQVIDLNGRILSSEQIEGSAETRIDAAPGLYLIRLINGENVKVQKVVVR